MSSLARAVLLALATLTATGITTAAAPTGSGPLTRRADYHPSSAPQEDDYCGEAVPRYSHGPSAPLVADCRALPDAHPGPGYWLVTAGETESREAAAAAGADDRWTRLAASGTCAVEVRLSHQNDAARGGPGVVDYRFGTNDLRFYVRAHLTDANARDGRAGISSGVWCRRGDVQGQVVIDFRFVSA
ncbi:hypothetical protein VTG60DRAFT_6193 [Thermothelomyces hinnuleus]